MYIVRKIEHYPITSVSVSKKDTLKNQSQCIRQSHSSNFEKSKTRPRPQTNVGSTEHFVYKAISQRRSKHRRG